MPSLLSSALSYALENVGTIAALVIFASVVAWASVTVDDWLEPMSERPEPDTIEVERTITRRDTVTQTVPRTVRVYDTVRSTERIYVNVPTDWRPQGLIGQQPLDISGSDATLTYFNPAAGRYEQKVYDIPRPSNRISAVTEAFLMPQTAGVLGGGQYAHRWTDVPLISSVMAEWTAGYAVTTEGVGPAGRVSLSADVTW